MQSNLKEFSSCMSISTPALHILHKDRAMYCFYRRWKIHALEKWQWIEVGFEYKFKIQLKTFSIPWKSNSTTSPLESFQWLRTTYLWCKKGNLIDEKNMFQTYSIHGGTRNWVFKLCWVENCRNSWLWFASFKQHDLMVGDWKTINKIQFIRSSVNGKSDTARRGANSSLHDAGALTSKYT